MAVRAGREQGAEGVGQGAKRRSDKTPSALCIRGSAGRFFVVKCGISEGERGKEDNATEGAERSRGQRAWGREQNGGAIKLHLHYAFEVLPGGFLL